MPRFSTSVRNLLVRKTSRYVEMRPTVP
jgi:hypothetical protein